MICTSRQLRRAAIRCLAIVFIAWVPILGQRPLTPPVKGVLDARPDHFAFQNATVYVRPGLKWERATVVIQDGVITQVGTDVEVPQQARVIDCTHRILYPGFIDCFRECDVSEVSSRTGYWNEQITPERSAATALAELPDLNEWREAGFVAQLVAPKDGRIKGTSALVATADQEQRHLVLNSAAAMHASLTVPFDFGRPAGYPGSPMGALTLVRQALYDSAWYREAWRVFQAGGATQQPEYNASLESLVRAEDDRLPWIIDASNERYVLRADRLGREFNLSVIVRGSGREYRRLEDVVATTRGVILPLDFPQAPDVALPEAAHYVTLERLLHWDLAPENPARLARAGVPIGFTTAGLKSPADFWPALRKAIRRGLEPAAALAALTTTPAQWFHVTDRLGTIERGKAASFVIADNELFQEDGDSQGTILETWVHGIRFRHAASTQDDVRGTWTLQLADGKDAVSCDIAGRPGRLRATVKSGEKSHKADRVQYENYHLAFTVPADLWGQEGIARFTVVLTDPALEKAQSGQGIWPDGTSFGFTMQRQAAGSRPETGQDRESELADDDREEIADARRAPPGRNAGGSDRLPRTALFDVTYPLGAYGIEEATPPPSCVVFQNATVWTCGPAGKLEDTDIVVSAGVIQAIGKKLPVPEGAVVVPCKGKHVTPGIIDCHSHIATDGGLNEGTQAITAEVRIADFIDADDISIYRQLAGGVTAANILHGSANPIGGQNQVIKLRWGASPEAMKFREAPAGIKFALGENVKQSNWGDHFVSRYPQTRMGVDELIDDAFRRAAQYQRQQDSWQQTRQGLPPRVDLELAALAEVLAGKRWIHCHSYRQSEILALMKTCDRHGVQIGTFQHALEGYKVANEMARRGIMASAFSDWWAYKFEVYDAIPYAGALMHEAGVVVSFNSDDPELGRRLNLEAAKAMRYGGLPPEEALKFVTLNPARQLRIDRWVGSLEPGKHADLVVWSGSPLSVFSRCEQTWIDGKNYFDWSENARREERDARRYSELVQRILSSHAPTVKAEDEKPEPDSLWPRIDPYCHGHPHAG